MPPGPPGPPSGSPPPQPWYKTRNGVLAILVAVIILAITGSLAGRNDSPKTASTDTTVPTTTTVIGESTTAATTSTTSATPTTIPETTASTKQAVMPAVPCGTNLQDAQNMVQAAGVFYSRSTDATGRGRHQILDRDWVVVGQTPPAGTPIGEGDAVFSVVKISEFQGC